MGWKYWESNIPYIKYSLYTTFVVKTVINSLYLVDSKEEVPFFS